MVLSFFTLVAAFLRIQSSFSTSLSECVAFTRHAPHSVVYQARVTVDHAHLFWVTLYSRRLELRAKGVFATLTEHLQCDRHCQCFTCNDGETENQPLCRG